MSVEEDCKLGAWFDMVSTFHLGVLGGYNLFPKPLTIRLPAQEPPGPLLNARRGAARKRERSRARQPVERGGREERIAC